MYLLPQSRFLRGFLLGLSGASMLLYVWHTETMLAQQQANKVPTVAQPTASTTSALQQQLHLIELLQKSYSISEGTEETDVRQVLQQRRHFGLFEQLVQQTRVDISDLIQPNQGFSAAQFYAALMRMRQQLERQAAQAELDALSKPATPTTATP
ncbi:MAG TPA: hypothetical protein DCS87_08040 [Rheinheimera sp.]|nr:hypothetical protein [Rheinheimera sp.]